MLVVKVNKKEAKLVVGDVYEHSVRQSYSFPDYFDIRETADKDFSSLDLKKLKVAIDDNVTFMNGSNRWWAAGVVVDIKLKEESQTRFIITFSVKVTEIY